MGKTMYERKGFQSDDNHWSSMALPDYWWDKAQTLCFVHQYRNMSAFIAQARASNPDLPKTEAVRKFILDSWGDLAFQRPLLYAGLMEHVSPERMAGKAVGHKPQSRRAASENPADPCGRALAIEAGESVSAI